MTDGKERFNPDEWIDLPPEEKSDEFVAWFDHFTRNDEALLKAKEDLRELEKSKGIAADPGKRQQDRDRLIAKIEELERSALEGSPGDSIKKADDKESLSSIDGVSRDGDECQPTEEVRENYQFSFYKNGDVWMVGEYGREVLIKHTNGMGFVNFLLQHPRKDIPAKILYHHGAGITPGETSHKSWHALTEMDDEEYAMDEGVELSIDGSMSKKVNRSSTKNTARKALHDLKGRIGKTTDGEERERLQQEHDRFSAYLKDERRPKYSSQDERARQNIKKSINLALSNIKKKAEEIKSELFIKELNLIKCGHSPMYGGNASWELFRE